MVNVWRLMAYHDRNENIHTGVIAWAIANSRIAIGWPFDVRQFVAPVAITTEAYAIFNGASPGYVPSVGDQLWNFCHVMRPDDLVILKSCQGFRHSVVMRVVGDYTHEPPPPPLPFAGFGYHNQRKAVRIADKTPRSLWNAAGGLPGVRASGQSIYNALILMPRQVGC